MEEERRCFTVGLGGQRVLRGWAGSQSCGLDPVVVPDPIPLASQNISGLQGVHCCKGACVAPSFCRNNNLMVGAPS